MAGAGALHVSRAAKDTYNRCGTWDSRHFHPATAILPTRLGQRRTRSRLRLSCGRLPGWGVGARRDDEGDASRARRRPRRASPAGSSTARRRRGPTAPPGAGVPTARAERARHTAVSRSEPGHSLDA